MTDIHITDIQWDCPVGAIGGVRAEVPGQPGRGVARAVGVPYATAGRHEAPRRVTALSDLPPPLADGQGSPARVFPATEPGPTCPQRPSPASKLIAPHAEPRHHDEHCQHLSVTVPEGTEADAGLPVMVWIHGGANVSGGGDLDRFDPSQLVAERGVIVVSVTFRLGAYGFVFGTDGREPDANFALLDIRAALEWIRENISSFGGDPGNVTLFGQSAGADLILSLMVAAGAEKLAAVPAATPPPFRRVILQSLPFGFLVDRSDMYAAMNDAAGPIPADAPEDAVLDAQERATAAARKFKSGQGMPFGVRYGLDPLPDASRSDECLAAIAPDVDVMLGHTPREGSLFFHTSPEAAKMRRVPLVGEKLYEGAMRLITKSTYGQSLKFARTWLANGGRAYHYDLDWGEKKAPYRSAHTCDLPLLLGGEESWRDSVLTEGRSWAVVDADRRAMQAVWASFASTGRVPEADAAAASSFLKVREVLDGK